MSLESAVNAWNGKHLADLDSVYKQFFKQSNFVNDLLLLCQQKQQRAAGILFLKYLSEGGTLSPSQKDQFFHVLSWAKDPKTQLLWLQCLPWLRPAPEAHLTHLENFLLAGLSSKNRHVRAWSMNGLYDLASDYPQCRVKAKQWLANNPEAIKSDASQNLQQLMPFE